MNGNAPPFYLCCHNAVPLSWYFPYPQCLVVRRNSFRYIPIAHNRGVAIHTETASVALPLCILLTILLFAGIVIPTLALLLATPLTTYVRVGLCGICGGALLTNV